MPKSDEPEVDREQVQGIVSAHAAPPELWDAADADVVARYQSQLVHARWDDHRARSQLIANKAFVQATTDDDALHAALQENLSSYAPGPDLPPTQPFPSTCTAHVAAPPYPVGDPLQEQFGFEATVVDAPLAPVGPAPSSWLPSSAPAGMRTFSQLALPRTGGLSLGVGLGKLRLTPTTYTLHPPMDDYLVGPLPESLLEISNAAGTIGWQLPTSVPWAGHGATTVYVTVNLSIEGGSRPFHLLVPPPVAPPGSEHGQGILTAIGDANVILLGANGETSLREPTRFLERSATAFGPIGTPITRQQLTVQGSLALQPTTWWVYVGVHVRLLVSRFIIYSPPPLDRRDGFVGIDLRAPGEDTHSIHPLLQPNGPVRVRRIELNFCTEPVFA